MFDLSQLLAYRNGLFSPDQVLNKIEDRSIKELVRMDYSFRIISVSVCSFSTYCGDKLLIAWVWILVYFVLQMFKPLIFLSHSLLLLPFPRSLRWSIVSQINV